MILLKRERRKTQKNSIQSMILLKYLEA